MCDAFVSGNRSGLWRFGPANDVHAMTDGSFVGGRDRIHAPSMPRARPFGFNVAPKDHGGELSLQEDEGCCPDLATQRRRRWPKMHCPCGVALSE